MPQIQRTQKQLQNDKDMFRALVALAADVELFTIPLYMSALYSIAGTEAKQDGAVFPYMGPTEKFSFQGHASQKAYNIIYSVYIQEMLHLQLALNIGNIIGHKASLAPLPYPVKPNDPNWIPCLGELGNLNPTLYPEFANIKSVLGPLDENAINLFLAIELPDEDSLVEPPTVPLSCQPDDVASTTFGGIGKLYDIIIQYMDFVYPDDTTLFANCFEEARANAGGSSKDIVQINLFVDADNSQSSYSHMTLKLSENADAIIAAAEVKDMIIGIISEGEGSNRSCNNFVSPNYRPDADDLPVDALWGAYSHWSRFESVKYLYNKVVTWPKWIAERQKTNADKQAWQWQDLFANPLAITAAQKTLAEQRAVAWNDSTTANQLNSILNNTFTRFLDTLNSLWQGKAKSGFPFGAMQAISSRVSSVWAAGGTPEFKLINSGKTKGLHSCQGMNDKTQDGKAKGLCDCATAIEHSCAGTNSCKHQGGCGYAVNSNPELNFIPRENSCAGIGGCGSPIPSAQVFTDSKHPSSDINGKNVWDHAWNTFHKKPLSNTDLPKSSNIRVILPPS
jgi:hypothetical protein